MSDFNIVVYNNLPLYSLLSELKFFFNIKLNLHINEKNNLIKFIEKYDLPFSLISDEEKKVVEDYGVWGLKKFMGKEYMGISRTTFVIDEKGMIEDIIEKVNTKEHTTQILK